MYELKTKAGDEKIEEFLSRIEKEGIKADCIKINQMMTEITGESPQIWGASMIGFGKYQYKYASSHSGEFFITGFSPRKQNITLYIMAGFSSYDALLQKLGKHKTGKSCLYIQKLEDVNQAVLKELITASVAHMRETYKTS